MMQKHHSESDLSAALTMQELRNAKSRLPSGATGIFIQVTLVVIFMYLLVFANMMMGTAGAVLVSIMFLVAVFIPMLTQIAKQLWRQR
jgi:ABC-type bacteriocin/lantibiotic exporter with double-glycine peptidase domain